MNKLNILKNLGYIDFCPVIFKNLSRNLFYFKDDKLQKNSFFTVRTPSIIELKDIAYEFARLDIDDYNDFSNLEELANWFENRKKFIESSTCHNSIKVIFNTPQEMMIRKKILSQKDLIFYYLTMIKFDKIISKEISIENLLKVV